MKTNQDLYFYNPPYKRWPHREQGLFLVEEGTQLTKCKNLSKEEKKKLSKKSKLHNEKYYLVMLEGKKVYIGESMVW
jgi:hypothetical protein